MDISAVASRADARGRTDGL